MTAISQINYYFSSDIEVEEKKNKEFRVHYYSSFIDTLLNKTKLKFDKNNFMIENVVFIDSDRFSYDGFLVVLKHVLI